MVASVWRELVPNYTVRDVFAAKREEVRGRAAAIITQKLAADGIVVKEVDVAETSSCLRSMPKVSKRFC